ncbi:FAD-dependent oxidoreductase [Streptomyces sp. NPDC047043]|uniref:FAD-dependent oxidoreductase n=1 Tax=Streptomyces sp. NPDC047043 TaxID=3154497 RepID=UPI0033F98BDE
MTEPIIDVLVIGAGGAGLTAAVSAAQAGARVVVVEKTDYLGGPYRINPGSIGTFAVESWMQQTRHLGPSLAEAYRILMEHSRWRADGRVVSALLRNSASTVTWFNELGITFDHVIAYYNGAQPVWHIRDTPHDPVIADVLERHARALGVEFLLNTRALRLITREGVVRGAELEDADGPQTLLARSTVLATGGYQGNPDLIERYTGLRQGHDLFTFEMFTHPQHQGEGLQMAWDAGAGTSPTMLETYIYLPDPFGGPGGTMPELSAFRQAGLLVNDNGLRFVDESVMRNPADAANAVRCQPGSHAYMLLSDRVDRQLREQGLDFQLFGMHHAPGSLAPLAKQVQSAVDSGYRFLFRADTLGELAAQTGMPADQLQATVAEYDGACARGVDEGFFKEGRYLRPLGPDGPYYAAKFCLGSYGSAGGVATDEYGRALDERRRPVPGLYVIGRDAAHVFGDTYPFVFAGLIQGLSHTIGRITGGHAALVVNRGTPDRGGER